MSSFFTNEAVSLEKRINLEEQPVKTKLENIDSKYEIQRCVKWIQSNNFLKVKAEKCHLLRQIW